MRKMKVRRKRAEEEDKWKKRDEEKWGGGRRRGGEVETKWNVRSKEDEEGEEPHCALFIAVDCAC